MTDDSRNLRILLADDHVTVRQGLKMLIESQGDMTVVSEASDGTAAVEQARALRPDVVVMDISLEKAFERLYEIVKEREILDKTIVPEKELESDRLMKAGEKKKEKKESPEAPYPKEDVREEIGSPKPQVENHSNEG